MQVATTAARAFVIGISVARRASSTRYTVSSPVAAKVCAGADLVRAGAEDLPFEEDSFYTVVVTLVLCTVPDQPAYAWVPGHWVQRPGGWVWVEGHWRGR